MRLFRKWGKVCQNCNFGDNKKGKWIKRRFRNPHPKGHWHVYCTRKERFYPWDKYKRCFKETEDEEVERLIDEIEEIIDSEANREMAEKELRI